MSDRLCALILAAGASSRMGKPKALLSMNGQTLLARAAATAGAAGLELTVAVPAGDNSVAQAAAELGERVVEVPDAAEGMSASIRAGIAALSSDSAVAGVLIMLADQWRIGPEDLKRLIVAWKGASNGLAAARYAGTLGVPAIFGRSWFGALAALEGDQGARGLLRNAAPPPAVVDLPAAADDLDTPAELADALADGTTGDNLPMKGACSPFPSASRGPS